MIPPMCASSLVPYLHIWIRKKTGILSWVGTNYCIVYRPNHIHGRYVLMCGAREVYSGWSISLQKWIAAMDRGDHRRMGVTAPTQR